MHRPVSYLDLRSTLKASFITSAFQRRLGEENQLGQIHLSRKCESPSGDSGLANTNPELLVEPHVCHWSRLLRHKNSRSCLCAPKHTWTQEQTPNTPLWTPVCYKDVSGHICYTPNLRPHPSPICWALTHISNCFLDTCPWLPHWILRFASPDGPRVGRAGDRPYLETGFWLLVLKTFSLHSRNIQSNIVKRIGTSPGSGELSTKVASMFLGLPCWGWEWDWESW